MLTLGAFALDAPVGRGGMGVVWRGHHLTEGTPVAVKVIAAEAVGRGSVRAAIEDEVRAVARLNHPGIVWVHDMGEVPAAAALASDGALAAGQPYLVMELASGGSLDRAPRPATWEDLRRLLAALLDALAHAHARGVVHRDLKPGNILLSHPPDPRPGLKLSDFGIARALDADHAAGVVTGTPRYMAPEQFQGRWRDFGPWTDLYALGCVAWELATGAAPFDGAPSFPYGHLVADLPPFRPDRPVPEGFGDWLRVLLEKEPADRFSTAADALAALASLGAALAGPVPQPADDALLAHPTIPIRSLDEPSATTQTIAELDAPPAPRAPRPAAARFPLPTFPTTWRAARPPAPPALPDSGLSLYALRTVPLTGRETERDALWAMVGEVVHKGRPAAVALVGAAGNGKSRLAAWLSQRAHEVGAATTLRVVHGAGSGAGQGLGWMVRRTIGAVGLSRPEVLVRARRVLADLGGADEGEALALTELLAPCADDEPGQRVRLETGADRHAVVYRLVERLAARRPVILWIDDAQWGVDALRFVEGVMNGALPVLVVLTVQSEALAEEPEAAARLDALGRRLVRVPVDPLPPSQRVRLVTDVLCLDPELADVLGARTGGNPLFLLQLVGDWVQRGILVASAGGFVLRAGAPAELPEDLGAVWAARLDRLIPGPSPQRSAVELAAAFGQEVDDAEWAEACGLAGADAAGAHAILHRHGLLVRGAQGWAFVHGMFRETVVRGARERWAALHGVCADVVARRPEPGAVMRLGEHLHAAGRYEEAIGALLAGARAALRRDDHRAARRLLLLREEALTLAGVPERDVRRGEGALQWAKVRLQDGDFEGGLSLALEIEANAVANGWVRLAGRAAIRAGEVALRRGELPRAEAYFGRALGHARAAGDAEAVGMALRSLGQVAVLAGDVPRAESFIRAAHEQLLRHGDLLGVAMCLNARGDIARLERRWADARGDFLEALAIHERIGNRTGVSLCRHGIAEIDRLEGDLVAAERGYRETIALDATIGRDASVAQLNLGLCLLARGRHGEARVQLERVREVWTAQKKPGYLACVCVALLPCLVAAGELDAYDHTVAEAERLLEVSGMADPDLAWPAEAAAALARARGEEARARRAEVMASAQRARLR